MLISQASGDLKTQVGALKRMGVQMTDEEANATVAHYDLDGTGEMSYEVLQTHDRIMYILLFHQVLHNNKLLREEKMERVCSALDSRSLACGVHYFRRSRCVWVCVFV